MDDVNKLCEGIKDKFLNSTPDIWQRIIKTAARKVAEQLINELNGVPSKCGKLVYEQVNEQPIIGRVA